MSERPKLKAHGRQNAVKEWIGRTPDSVPTPSVGLRIFERQGGICHISKRKIMPTDAKQLDHIKRLEDGGENRESNLSWALKEEHAKKTADENRRGAKAKRVAIKHNGMQAETDHPLKSRGFQKAEKPSKYADPNPQLPRRQFYKDARS